MKVVMTYEESHKEMSVSANGMFGIATLFFSVTAVSQSNNSTITLKTVLTDRKVDQK
ncbi:hypothetical protein [Paenibacillus sp. N3.4]|uniref:hypothetical protein n=1 Tax=Paenibacillus sp. N3.4 TaxID=2603222 RepID=UPI00164F730E|nr:hypothetical protein [Paenibacillus sp. N3.4]